MLGVEVIEVKGGYFTCPRPGVKKEMEKSIIPEALFSLKINRFKDL